MATTGQYRTPRKGFALAPGMKAPVQAGELAVVVGTGASGKAAALLLHALGAQVRLVDRSASAVPEDVRAAAEERGMELVCGAHEPAQFAGAAVVVTSPGVPPEALRPHLAEAGNPPLIAETELGLRYAPAPVLAVTGTSGKTTTVSLAAAMLEQAGQKVFLGGNIGTPLSAYVLEGGQADVLVLELSSFQLQAGLSLHPRVAVVLNLTANHLDHHKDMAEYSDAKFSIFSRQTAADTALVPEELEDEYRRRGCAAQPTVIRPCGRFPDMRLLGRHNAFNAEAAFLACREFGVSEAEARAAAAAFAPLRHRLERAGEINGVVYVNDSKCTTVEAMRAALESFDVPVVLLAGGKFKGGDLASLRPLLGERVKSVELFGASREIFEEAWRGAVPLSWSAELPEAFARASRAAGPGEAVLLSPATASYDLYKNYMERGDHFCRLAEAAAQAGNIPAGEGDR